ncbi:intraflagellar transport protein 22 homolog [Chrysoperla carnea]|uniref:intraflagellar transport protein 22 homolog n=1 Tax=Chrysoperla carnea TaxID=189513 RepID=UPI001D085BF1|nr:intraflagellar transport protein 22 homolog [Chrysoperla carnea]
MKKQKLKILLIGPCGTGKTSIANTLSDNGPKWKADGSFKLGPTKALRIVEFDYPDLNVNNEHITAEIELWDTSGDDQYKLTWPALRHETHGVIFVYSRNSTETNRKLEIFYNYFVTQPKLSARQCFVINHILPNNESDIEMDIVKLSPTFAKLSQIKVNLSENSLKLKNDFRVYVTSLLSTLKNHRKE